MTRISNYDDLVAERTRIENAIVERKASIGEGLHEIKEKLEPFLYLLPVLSVFRKNSSVLKVAASLALNAFAGRASSKSNWLTRFIVPVLKRFM